MLFESASPIAPAFTAPEFLEPLRRFYQHARRPLPEVTPLSSELMPLPYRHLLVHQRDMTPTLESFHGRDIFIEVLRRERRGDAYCREVVLRLEGNGRGVEFGANQIHLQHFPPEARWMILQEQVPLGRILRDHGLPHQTRPLSFFQVVADRFIGKALGVRPGEMLHGRQARITDHEGRLLSEVVEVLPPVRGVPPRDG